MVKNLNVSVEKQTAVVVVIAGGERGIITLAIILAIALTIVIGVKGGDYARAFNHHFRVL
jgi:hypothetical protein